MSHNLFPIVGIPATVEFRTTPCTWTAKPHPHIWVVEAGQQVHPVRLYEREGHPLNGKNLDPWKLREWFLSIQDDAGFLAFLKATGIFSKTLKNGVWGFDHMRSWQVLIRKLMELDPWHWNPWLDKHQLAYRQQIVALNLHQDIKTAFRWKKNTTALVFKANDTVTALYATIVLDKLTGTKFRFCARPDCRKPFEIQSHHNKKYCDWYCAHIEVIRRGRAKKRVASKTKKRKSA